jgi:hypothetical protein
MRAIFYKILCITFLLSSVISYAHVPEQGYIYLRIYENKGVEGRFEIQVSDLIKIFSWDLETSGNKIEALLPHYEELKTYLLANSSFTSPLGSHKISFKNIDILPLGRRDYVEVYFELDNFETIPDTMDVTYTIAFKEIPSHKGFLLMEYNWKAGVVDNESNISLSFTPESPTDTLDLTTMSVWKGFVLMIQQGIWHIWIGIDHIFFLIALILPAVVRRRQEEGLSPMKSWKPVDRFKPAFYYIIKIITFFTIAHTITLSLAALQIVSLPGWIIESIIALSIGLVAFHNIKPIFKGREWVIAFVFGLFHGFGFATVLGDIGLEGEFLVYSLLGFNIGVEIGQFVIIALTFPLLYFIRKRKLYSKILVVGSIFLILASIYWIIERVFDVNLGLEDAISYGFRVIRAKLFR